MTSIYRWNTILREVTINITLGEYYYFTNNRKKMTNLIDFLTPPFPFPLTNEKLLSRNWDFIINHENKQQQKRKN